MKVIIKGCTKDVIDDIFEQLGSLCVLEIECIDFIDKPIYQIELDATKCLLHVFPEWLYLIRTDTLIFRDTTIANFRFEEVIIKWS